MVTSASVSGRRNARCPNDVMNALALPAASVGAFAGTRRASAVASPVTLSASFSAASKQLRAQLLGDEQGVGFVVEADQRVTRHAAVDVRDVRQLQQVADGVRPLLAAEPRHPGRRHQHGGRRRRRDGVRVPAETGAALARGAWASSTLPSPRARAR